jgi:hypothetical protein
MPFELRGKHSIADFLNDTFSIVPRIWKRALPVSVAAILPGSALLAASISALVGMIEAIVADSEIFKDNPALAFSSFAPFFVLLVLASLALFLGMSFQKAFICAEAGDAIGGRQTALGASLRRTIRPAFARIVAQDFIVESLASAIVFGIIFLLFFPFCFGAIARIIEAPNAEDKAFASIIALMGIYFLVILVAEAAAWWIKVKTAVAAPAAVLERVNAFTALGRSVDLVRGRSWRIFGSMFIVSLVISFGLGILLGPITFVVILPGYFSILSESIAGTSPSPESIIAFLSSMSWALGLSVLVSGIVEGSLWSSFLTVLHADLRIRAGEKDAAAEEEPPAPSPAPYGGTGAEAVAGEREPGAEAKEEGPVA